MSTKKGYTPSKNTPMSDNSMKYTPKRRVDCVASSIKGWKEKSMDAGGLSTIDGYDPEAGTNVQNSSH